MSPSPLRMSLRIQREIDRPDLTDQQRVEIVNTALPAINQFWDPFVERAVRSKSAFFCDRDLTSFSSTFPFQKFGEIILRGSVPRISAAVDEEIGRLVMALPFVRAEIFGPKLEIESDLVSHELENWDTVLPLDTHLSRPLYVPIEDMEFVVLTSRG